MGFPTAVIAFWIEALSENAQILNAKDGNLINKHGVRQNVINELGDCSLVIVEDAAIRKCSDAMTRKQREVGETRTMIF